MNLSQNIKIALQSVRSNLLRAILTMLIIAFGIMALVGILTAIDVAIYSLSDNLSSMGANSFTIQPKRDRVSGNRGGRQSKIAEPISFKQAMTFQEKFNFPAKVTVYMDATGIAMAKYGKEKTNPNVKVVGIDENYLYVKGYDLEIGRNFTRSEVQRGSNEIIIGKDIVDILFDKKPDKAINQVIAVGNVKYRVVGVLASKGSSINSNSDRVVLASLPITRRYYGSANKNYNINVSVLNAEDMGAAEATSIGLFRNIRGLKLSQENDFKIFKSDSLISIIKDNTSTLRLSAVGIGLITLLGAAIGLMNIMLVSVTERTREVGICKALGATRRNIMVQFLTEAVVICQLGGLFGIVLGIIIGNLVTYALGGNFLIPWEWILLGITTCMFVGLLSGLYPAYKAARLDPIESLRYE
ncbi:MAG: ABC transporter permease [Bacteroidota bacterium]